MQKRKVITIQAPWRDNWQHRRYDIMSGVMLWNGRILEHGGQEGVFKEMLGQAGQTKLQSINCFMGSARICGEEGELQKSYFEALYIYSGCMAVEGHALDYDCFDELNEEYFKKQASVPKLLKVKKAYTRKREREP